MQQPRLHTAPLPPVHHQLHKHPHPHPQRRIREIKPIAVQRRITVPIRRLHPPQGKTPRHPLQVIRKNPPPPPSPRPRHVVRHPHRSPPDAPPVNPHPPLAAPPR